MPTIAKIQCPHCRSLLTVDRPDEPRVAPCPACFEQIQIPRDIVRQNYPAVEKTAGPLPNAASAAIPQKQAEVKSAGCSRWGAKQMAITAGILMSVCGSVAYAWKSSASGDVKAMVSLVQATRDDSHTQQLEAKVETFEQQLDSLVSQIENVTSEINDVDRSIQRFLNKTDLSVENVLSAYERGMK